MSILPEWRRLFRLPRATHRSVAAEIDSELEFHLQMRIDELVALGRTPAEAREEALRRFGNLAEARSSLVVGGTIRARRSRWATWLTDLRQDIGFAFRGLRRKPGFTAVVVATVGLGLGLTTTVLAVVNRLVLHPLPYPAAERLAQVWLAKPRSGIQISPSLEMLGAWGARSPDREWIEAHVSEELLLESGETAELVATRSVTPGLLSALGARIAVGRGIQRADTVAGAPLATLLSWGTWQRRFGGSPDALGRTVRLDGRVATIVGVIGKGFDLTPLDGRARAEFWLPLGGPSFSKEQWASILLLRREGVADAAVNQALQRTLVGSGIRSDLLEEFHPAVRDQASFADPTRERTLWLLTLAVSLVLAIACANVAALLLGQSAVRAQEFGVRAALGAGRGRVVRQLITESTILGGLGGAAGFGVAMVALWITRVFRPANLLAIDDVALEPRVVTVAIGVTMLVALVFGAAPAWAASRGDAAAALMGRIRRSLDTRLGRSLRGALVVGQFAASLVLVSDAGLLLRSFLAERNLPTGFKAEGLGWVQYDIPSRLVPQAAVREALTNEVATTVGALPSVAMVGISSDPPVGYGVLDGEFLIEGRPLPPKRGNSLMPVRSIGRGYFEAIGMRLDQGRPPDTRPGSLEIVIDRETAGRIWPAGDAVGKRVRFNREVNTWRTIVGVAPEQRALVGGFPDSPFILEPMIEREGGTLIVRGRGQDPLAGVSAAIRRVDSRIRIRSIVTAQSALDERLAGRRFTTTIVAAFAGLALLLAAVGLYGVIALAVGQRTYELGVRIALGAAPHAVRLMVLRDGAVRIGLGLGIGFVLVAGTGRLLRGMLGEVSAWDPVVWAGAGLVLALAGILACWVPARRASRIDPLIALRSD
jgi:putative ABC transport system permease protein